MSYEDEIEKAGDLLGEVFDSITSASMQKSSDVTRVWKEIIGTIKPDGERLAGHSRVFDLKNNVLLIETDHPGWTQLLQMHRKYILKGLSMRFPELEIKNLSFKLKTENFVEKKPSMSFDQIENEIKKQLGEADSYYKNKEMPPPPDLISEDLQKRLESLRKTILTNS